MNPVRKKPLSRPYRRPEFDKLRLRLAEAEETLRAIQSGEVDAVVVTGKAGPQTFTLQGAEHAYRVLIESMNEGALTLTVDNIILYANQCFARMIKYPLEQVIGSSFRRLFSVEDQVALQAHVKRAARSGSKIRLQLIAGDGSKMPVQISMRPLEKNGDRGATIGMVVTDLTESVRNEDLLRALSHRVVQIQEAERGRVALELHDTVTQMLCAVLVRCQVLVAKLPAGNKPAKDEAMVLRDIIGQTIEEVERISRNLQPSILNILGLVAGLNDTSTDFSARTGVAVKLVCVKLTSRLPADTELALYRILQETLKNVEKHARARNVTVLLTKPGKVVQLTIQDDGIGFDSDHHLSKRKAHGGLGLLGMSERASYVGGLLTVKSTRRGTEIEIRIPIP